MIDEHQNVNERLMMNLLPVIRCVLLLLFPMCIGCGGAQSTGLGSNCNEDGSGKKNLAVINYQTVLSKSRHGKVAKLKLGRMQEKYQADLDASQTRLLQQKANIETKKMEELNESSTQKNQDAQYLQQMMALQAQYEHYQKDLLAVEQEEAARILEIIKRAVDHVREEGCYEMIVDSSNELVSYSEKDTDLTEVVLELVNSGDFDSE